jgi:hypothetical protein
LSEAFAAGRLAAFFVLNGVGQGRREGMVPGLSNATGQPRQPSWFAADR